MIRDIAFYPLKGIAGARWNVSARSSVTINLGYVCSPDTAPLQVLPRIGFHAGASVDMASPSGLCLKTKTSPTVARIASRICADSSLRAARLVSKGAINFLVPCWHVYGVPFFSR